LAVRQAWGWSVAALLPKPRAPSGILLLFLDLRCDDSFNFYWFLLKALKRGTAIALGIVVVSTITCFTLDALTTPKRLAALAVEVNGSSKPASFHALAPTRQARRIAPFALDARTGRSATNRRLLNSRLRSQSAIDYSERASNHVLTEANTPDRMVGTIPDHGAHDQTS